VRIEGEICAKPHRAVGPGDTLTFPQGRRVRVVRIEAVGQRRGPAPEAQALYEDLSPEAPPRPVPGPRPTGRDRRAIDRLGRPDD
jgi:ribosome-associated heat shock protein Hsp15